MLDDVACCIMFFTASPDSFTSVTCSQCDPALIHEENDAPMADLPILVIQSKDPNKTKLKTNQSGIISREQLFMATICKIIPFLGVVLLLPL